MVPIAVCRTSCVRILVPNQRETVVMPCQILYYAISITRIATNVNRFFPLLLTTRVFRFILHFIEEVIEE